MSPEENEDLNTRVRLSGLTKQDYLINRALCRDVVVMGNPRVHKLLRNQMAEILEELKRLECSGDASEEFLETLRLVAEIWNGLKEADMAQKELNLINMEEVDAKAVDWLWYRSSPSVKSASCRATPARARPPLCCK
mgnify:CR=1 FL=1